MVRGRGSNSAVRPIKYSLISFVSCTSEFALSPRIWLYHSLLLVTHPNILVSLHHLEILLSLRRLTLL